MFDAGSIGQCVKQSLPWESSECVLHTLRPQSTRVTTFHKGIVECASWPGFLLEVRMSPESLSRQYFWLGQLDQGQLYSVRMIICLAYIPDMRKNFKKVIFLKNLFSELGYFAGIWVNLTTENSWCSRTREVTLTHISSFFSKPDANITNNAS